MLQISKSSLPEHCFDSDGHMTERGAVDVMTAVEKQTGQLLKDWYMVELAVSGHPGRLCHSHLSCSCSIFPIRLAVI